MTELPEIVPKGKQKKPSFVIIPLSVMEGFLDKHVDRKKPRVRESGDIWSILVLRDEDYPPRDVVRKQVIKVLEKAKITSGVIYVDIRHTITHQLHVHEAHFATSKGGDKIDWVGEAGKGKYVLTVELFARGSFSVKKLLEELKYYDKEEQPKYKEAFRERWAEINKNSPKIGSVYLLRHIHVKKKSSFF